MSIIEGGGLRLTADATKVNNLYPGSQIMSATQYLYGFFEVRCKVPAAYLGPWCGPWMWSGFNYDLTKPEIDICEYANGPRYYYASWTDTVRNGGDIATGDLTTAYHTFGCRWQSDEIRWYFDGVEVAVNTEHIPQQAMNIFIMLIVGGFGGPPSPAEAFPCNFDVDYVKIWQEAE